MDMEDGGVEEGVIGRLAEDVAMEVGEGVTVEAVAKAVVMEEVIITDKINTG